MATKTDNHNARAKLALRRHFLTRYHSAAPPDVADCFSGHGVLWSQLRKEFTVAAYTPIELRHIPARLRMDSLEYLRRGDWSHDVIDLDAYGTPWEHFGAVLPRIKAPTTVFLTYGSIKLTEVPVAMLRAMGITFTLPRCLRPLLKEQALNHGLALPYQHGLQIVEALEAPNPGASTRYVGLHLVPASQLEPPKKSAPEKSATATPADAAGHPSNRKPSLAARRAESKASPSVPPP